MYVLQVRDLVPESQAYMDLLAFERKLDATITRKRLDIQEALKRPMKVCKRPQVLINNFFERKIVNIFLPIHFNIYFGCSKEPSH